MPVTRAKNAALGIFHPGWMLAGLGLGLFLQLSAGLLQIGLLGGLSGYFVMGLLVGVASPGSTIVEPGVAGFLLAAISYVFDHFVLSLFGVGLVVAAGYGAVGMLLAVGGAWIGEAL